EGSPHPVSPLARARGSPTLPLQGRVVTARSVQACKRARRGAAIPASVERRAPLPSPGGGGSPPSEREAAGWGELFVQSALSGERAHRVRRARRIALNSPSETAARIRRPARSAG